MKHLLVIAVLLSYVTLYAQRRDITPTDSFSVTGHIKKDRVFRIADIINMKQNALGDVIVRNHKGDPKDTLTSLKGVLLKDLLDVVDIVADKPKDYSELCILLTASDCYRNVYSWNEIYNTDVGNHIYIVTEVNGKSMQQMDQHILVMSLADINSGRRHLKALAKIEIRKID